MQELLKLKETNKNVHNKYELNVDSLVVNLVVYQENFEVFKKVVNSRKAVSCYCVVCDLENSS